MMIRTDFDRWPPILKVFLSVQMKSRRNAPRRNRTIYEERWRADTVVDDVQGMFDGLQSDLKDA